MARNLLGIVLLMTFCGSFGRELTIISKSKYFLKGESFSLNCTVRTAGNQQLNWSYPSKISDKVKIATYRNDNVLCSQISIVNATKEDAGEYTCKSNNFTRTYVKHLGPKLVVDISKNVRAHTVNGKKTIIKNIEFDNVSIAMSVDAYPEPTTYFLRDGKNISTTGPKYQVVKRDTGDIALLIDNLTWTDITSYTFVAVNSLGTRKVTFDLLLKAAPQVNFGTNGPIKKTVNETLKLSCNIKSCDKSPPEIQWTFVPEIGSHEVVLEAKNKNESLYEIESLIEFQVHTSGKIICSAKNSLGSHNATKMIYAYDIKNGFGIKEGPRWYPEHDDMVLECIASKYDYSHVFWEFGDEYVYYQENDLSHVAVLKIRSIEQWRSGYYKCAAWIGQNKTALVYDSVYIEVEENRKPRVHNPSETIKATISQPVQLICQADAVPPPDIMWYKDENKIINGTDGLQVLENSNHTVLTSIIAIKSMKEQDQGIYKCVAGNRIDDDTKIVTLKLAGDHFLFIAIFSIALLTLTVIVIYLTWKVKREKQLRLAAAGLLNFKEGALESINPALNVDEQAELLPYDERFEFPAEKLALGKQLGSGAFGVVYKAEARGILNAEETTTVAVKTVKKTADDMYIKALASELKIMVHMGKHVNIVNLLGACTKNIAKRELMVIVEYCRFGNIHNYLIKHREVFINQLTTDSNNEKFGHDNNGYSGSIDSGMRTDNGNYNHSQTTAQTCLNTANSSTSTKKVSEGYVLPPEWHTNYENDYQNAVPRPLFSHDLLAWAFQIARGMEYLASRKVLHGDLAARNVVLADDNVVKICDFGLARSIYKNDEYKKKEDSLLPMKWLAVECLSDRIFSTQSDVWSFGVVLWELFSLGKTPYPDQNKPTDFYQYLMKGKRMDKPKYADDKLYAVMLKCWHELPKKRPSFTVLQEELGSFLEEADRNRYIHLNSSYEDQNAKITGQDLLAMMNSPDYNNLVTPSPCENGNFFPQTPKSPQDHAGYLLSIRQNFNFEPQNAHKAPSQLRNEVSELTPMLNLDNVPETGSHSDFEDVNPAYRNFPRIDEEIKEEGVEELDEVFDTNTKIITGNAVGNPTYVTINNLDRQRRNLKTFTSILYLGFWSNK